MDNEWLSLLMIPVMFVVIVVLVIQPIVWVFRFFLLWGQVRAAKRSLAAGPPTPEAKRAYNGVVRVYNANLTGYPGFLFWLFLRKPLLEVPPAVIQTPAGKLKPWPEEQLRSWYEHTIRPGLTDLEDMRRRICGNDRLYPFLGLALPIGGGAAYWYFTQELPGLDYWISGLIMSAVVFTWLYHRNTRGLKQRYDSAYKSRVVEPLIAFLNKNTVYDPHGSMRAAPVEEFESRLNALKQQDLSGFLFTALQKNTGISPEAMLEKLKQQGTAGAGLIERAHGAWSFKFSFAPVPHPFPRPGAEPEDDFSDADESIAYRGETDLSVEGRIFILRGVDALSSGRNPSRLREYHGCALVLFGDPAFTRTFAVYADSAADAHRVLSEPVRAALLVWNDRVTWPFKLILNGPELFAAFPKAKELLSQGPLRESLNDFDTVRERAAFLHCLDSLPMQIGLSGVAEVPAYPVWVH